jgi:hypothetical protein
MTLTSQGSNNKLLAVWTSEIKDPALKAKFQEGVRSQLSGAVFKKLRLIIEQELRALDQKERSTNQYEHAAWPYYQAHMNGQRDALKLVMDLITQPNE